MDLDSLISDCEATLRQIDDLSSRIDTLQSLLEKRLERLAEGIEDASEARGFPRSLLSLSEQVPSADDVIYDEERDEMRKSLDSIRTKLRKADAL